MTPNFPHLATRLFNAPLAITPGKIEVIMAAIADRFGVAKIFRMDGAALPMRAFDQEDESYSRAATDRDRGYDVAAGVAIIQVTGTLVQKLGALRPYSGMTGYDGIRAAFSMAMADDEVRAICLDIDSPGGEVAGCFDLADMIYRARGRKPIWAILSENAYSAAYAIASAADWITVPRTGGTGSVGVVAVHVSMSDALGDAGLEVTVLRSDALKYEGNEFEKLSADAQGRMMADIMKARDIFVSMVARNRGLTPAAVEKTQAGTFLGADGVKAGFADAVMAPDEAFSALVSSLGQ